MNNKTDKDCKEQEKKEEKKKVDRQSLEVGKSEKTRQLANNEIVKK